MRILSLIHRWTGGLIGLLLAVIGLSGTLLLWEDQWIGVPHASDPYAGDRARLADMVARLASGPDPVERITFAHEGLGVHQAVLRDGTGAYLAQSGDVVVRWGNEWGRPELWLFDLHHHLFAGETGEFVTGIAGLIGLFFVVSGTILWWRTRRTFRFRLWPARMTPSAIVRQHRDMGVVAAPLLLVSLVTGVLIVFAPLSQLVLAPWGAQAGVPAPKAASGERLNPALDWRALFTVAHARFPEAEFRRLQLPRKPGAAIALRLRQPFEWTPNGRTFLYFDPADGRLLGVRDPGAGSTADWIQEKLYPVHAAKTGGIVWRLLMTVSGLALTLLGGLATYGFWRGRAEMRARRHPDAGRQRLA